MSRRLTWCIAAASTFLIATLCAAVMTSGKARVAHSYPRFCIVPDGDAFLVLPRESAPADDSVGELVYHQWSRHCGFVAIRETHESFELREFYGTNPNWNRIEAHMPELRSCAARQVEASAERGRLLSGFDATKLAQGDYSVSCHSVTGYILDGCAYLGIIGAGLGFTAFARSTIRKDRLDALTRAGAICPHCQYDLRGLAAPVCPECGQGCSAPHGADR